MKELARRLRAEPVGRVEENLTLARFTTYRLGGPAALYVEPGDVKDLERLSEILADEKDRPEILVLGRGSNLVISDRGWPGLVIRLGAAFASVDPVPDGAGLRAGGATPMPLLANWSARRGLSGLEFAIAIPGSVGGAIRMNAGAHGGEVADRLRSVRVLDLVESKVREMRPSDLGFSYRTSSLSDNEVVVNADFDLTPSDPETVRARMESYRKHRADTQPGAVQNAGSVFRNPPGDHAGRLVEVTGLKGFRVGGASVSELHANFFIAGDGSTAQDVFDLVAQVIERVHDAHGVRLEPEVRFVGRFDPVGERA